MNDKIMLGTVAAIAVLLAVGSAAVLISNEVADDTSAIIDDSVEESALGSASALENAPDYTKYVIVGAIVLGAALVVRREIC